MIAKKKQTTLTAQQFRAQYPALYQEIRKDILDELIAKYDRVEQTPSRVIVAPIVLPAIKKVELPKPIGAGKSRSHAKKIDARTFPASETGPLWQIELSPLVARQLWGYWQGSGHLEISGLGVVSWDREPVPGEPFRAVIESIEFLSTGDTGGNSFIGSEEQGKYWLRLDNADIDIARARLWWHSHADMGCFWSSTDDGNIQGTMEEQAMDRKRTSGWSLSTVMSFSHGEQIRARIDYWDREKGDWTVDYIPVYQPAEVLADPIRMAIEEVDDARYAPAYNYSALSTYRTPLTRSPMPAWSYDGQDGLDSFPGYSELPAASEDLADEMQAAVLEALYDNQLTWVERTSPEAMAVISELLTDQEEQQFWSLFGRGN